MTIAKKTQKASQRSAVRTRLAGTPKRQDPVAQHNEDPFVDVELDSSGNMTTDKATLPRD